MSNTKLTILCASDKEYSNICKNFSRTLPHAKVHSIVKLNMPPMLEINHNAHKTSSRVLHQMFHGTRSVCNLSELKSRKLPCINVNCSVCGIIKEGNSLKKSNSGDVIFLDK